MEYIDVYTAQRQLTGRTQERGKTLNEGEYRIVVHAALFNKSGKLLIQQRQPFKKGWSGRWDLKGEPPCLSITFDHGFDDIYLLRGEVELERLQLQYEEVAQVKWADLEEIRQMLAEGTFVPYHRSLIDLLFAMRERNGGLWTE